MTTNEIADLARVTRDSEVALSALFARLVERAFAGTTSDQVLAAERTIVATRFGGNRGAYRAALGRDRATLAVARGVIADELRRRALQRRLSVKVPAVPQLAEFRETYGTMLARELEVEPSPSWLPTGRGLVLEGDAPARVFALPLNGAVTIRTSRGR